MTQYYSRVDTTYSGSAIFSIPFSYIKKDDVVVYIVRSETETEASFTWLNDTQITVTTALQSGDVISVRRVTPIDEKIVTYRNMSMVLNDDNLNASQDQLLNAVQEIYDNNVVFQADVDEQFTDYKSTVDSALNTIDGKADTAISTANGAVTTANSANSKADNAVSTANSANSKADNAVSTANTASSNASTAVNTANTAKNTADTAKETADNTKGRVDEFEEDIEAVIEAAEKIDELEEAVQTAVDAAQTASDKADLASDKADDAIAAADRAEAVIPSQTGHNGKFLKTNGTNTSWEEVDALPSQTGKNGKFLKTDGTDAFWEDIPSVEIDGVTITENTSDKLQTVGVIDQNNTSTAIKTWTGTKAQYNAIVTKDAETLYTITDDVTDNNSIVADLNNKADVDLTNCTVPVVVSRTPNSQGGITEIWSDGYCVQTGVKTSAGTVTFNYEFKDNTYNLLITCNSLTSYSGTIPLNQMGYTSKSNTGFYIYADGNLTKEWRAEGYIR